MALPGSSASCGFPCPAHMGPRTSSLVADLTRLQREVAELQLQRSLLLNEETEISEYPPDFK